MNGFVLFSILINTLGLGCGLLLIASILETKPFKTPVDFWFSLNYSVTCIIISLLFVFGHVSGLSTRGDICQFYGITSILLLTNLGLILSTVPILHLITLIYGHNHDKGKVLSIIALNLTSSLLFALWLSDSFHFIGIHGVPIKVQPSRMYCYLDVLDRSLYAVGVNTFVVCLLYLSPWFYGFLYFLVYFYSKKALVIAGSESVEKITFNIMTRGILHSLTVGFMVYGIATVFLVQIKMGKPISPVIDSVSLLSLEFMSVVASLLSWYMDKSCRTALVKQVLPKLKTSFHSSTSTTTTSSSSVGSVTCVTSRSIDQLNQDQSEIMQESFIQVMSPSL